MKTISIMVISVLLSVVAIAAPADAATRNCTRDGDPWTAVAAKVLLRGSDDWVRIAPLTDSIRKQIIQQRAQSMLEVKWCKA